MGDQRSVTGRTSQVLRDYRLKPKKSLGQNFLTDSRVLDKMVRAADIDKETGVLEVGPGIGSLTERLANVAGKVVAVEIDKRLIPILENTFASYDHVQIVCGDILALDVPKVLKEHLSGCRRTTVVANLPYYITSAVIMKLLELNWSFYRLVLMMQKEVAERVLAKPGSKDYGVLSVAVQYYATPEKVARVPAHVFVPRPHVDSAVLSLTPHKTSPAFVANRELFFAVVKSSFKERRKTLANNLNAHLFTDWNKSQVNEWLNRVGIDPRRRAETLSLAEFARISNALSDSCLI